MTKDPGTLEGIDLLNDMVVNPSRYFLKGIVGTGKPMVELCKIANNNAEGIEILSEALNNKTFLQALDEGWQKKLVDQLFIRATGGAKLFLPILQKTIEGKGVFLSDKVRELALVRLLKIVKSQPETFLPLLLSLSTDLAKSSSLDFIQDYAQKDPEGFKKIMGDEQIIKAMNVQTQKVALSKVFEHIKNDTRGFFPLLAGEWSQEEEISKHIQKFMQDPESIKLIVHSNCFSVDEIQAIIGFLEKNNYNAMSAEFKTVLQSVEDKSKDRVTLLTDMKDRPGLYFSSDARYVRGFFTLAQTEPDNGNQIISETLNDPQFFSHTSAKANYAILKELSNNCTSRVMNEQDKKQWADILRNALNNPRFLDNITPNDKATMVEDALRYDDQKNPILFPIVIDKLVNKQFLEQESNVQALLNFAYQSADPQKLIYGLLQNKLLLNNTTMLLDICKYELSNGKKFQEFLPPEILKTLPPEKIKEIFYAGILTNDQAKGFENYLKKNNIDNPFKPIITEDLPNVSPEINRMLKSIYLVTEEGEELSKEEQKFFVGLLAKGVADISQANSETSIDKLVKSVLNMATLADNKTICFADDSEYFTVKGAGAFYSHDHGVFVGNSSVQFDKIKSMCADPAEDSAKSPSGYTAMEASYLRLFVSVLIHEHLHAVISDVFQNHAEPFTENAKVELKEWLEEHSDNQSAIFAGFNKGRKEKVYKDSDFSIEVGSYIIQTMVEDHFQRQLDALEGKPPSPSRVAELYKECPALEKFMGELVKIIDHQYEARQVVSAGLVKALKTNPRIAEGGMMSMSDLLKKIGVTSITDIDPNDIVKWPTATPVNKDSKAKGASK